MIRPYLDSRVLRRFSFLFILSAMVFALPVAAYAQIGFDNFDGGTNRLSFSQNIDDSTSDPGDMFGVRSRSTITNGAGLPFGMSDDSVVAAAGNSVFPADTIGVVGQNKTDNFFGAVDLDNDVYPTTTGIATWTFDILGFEGLDLSIDIGALGDFENPGDLLVFSVDIDGGPSQTIFNFLADTAGAKFYRLMDSGAQPCEPPFLGVCVGGPINDPMVEQTSGIELDKTDPATGALDTFTGSITGTGSLLTLVATVRTNSGSEAIAFDNIVVGDSTPEFGLDIKPDGEPNSTNLMSQGLLPVAILSSAGFDALTIDPTTALYGDPGGGRVAAVSSGDDEDANGDGLIDLKLKFSIADLVAAGALDETSIAGLVTASTFGGDPLKGSDSIRIVPPGDANNDFAVDAADYTVWANQFGGSPQGNKDADFNGDGSIDAADYTIWANHFGEDMTPAGASASAVPEPSTLLLTCFGLIGFIAYGWRRRR